VAAGVPVVLRPENLGHFLARVLPSGVVGEVAEQRPRLLGPEVRDGRVSWCIHPRQSQPAKQLDSPPQPHRVPVLPLLIELLNPPDGCEPGSGQRKAFLTSFVALNRVRTRKPPLPFPAHRPIMSSSKRQSGSR